MGDQPAIATPARAWTIPPRAALALILVVLACSIYANLSFTVTNPLHYRFFPPFEPSVNANNNQHLGAEYVNIAESLLAGKGFAHPFDRPTGPTAWQGPVLPVILAGLLWLCGGSRNGVVAIVVIAQDLVLIGTGLLVLILARRTMGRVGVGAAAAVFLLALLGHFHLCFQFTHDCWLVLLALDLLVAAACWWRPLRDTKRAAGWGLYGGLCAQVSPVVGFTWGMCSLLVAWQQRAWPGLTVAVLCAVTAVLPWTVRNYLVFGRWIAVKSNAAYELYQSQCLQKDGLLQVATFRHHPYRSGRRERREYETLGEIAYLDRKREQSWQAISSDALGFLERLSDRFLGATLWYVPFDRAHVVRRPWVTWLSRLLHPLPFLGLLALVFRSFRQPLQEAQWVVICIYCWYLLPYLGVSYYDRYALPLLGVKVLLVLWAADSFLVSVSRGGFEETAALVPCGDSRPGARGRRSPVPGLPQTRPGA